MADQWLVFTLDILLKTQLHQKVSWWTNLILKSLLAPIDWLSSFNRTLLKWIISWLLRWILAISLSFSTGWLYLCSRWYLILFIFNSSVLVILLIRNHIINDLTMLLGPIIMRAILLRISPWRSCVIAIQSLRILNIIQGFVISVIISSVVFNTLWLLSLRLLHLLVRPCVFLGASLLSADW